VYALICADSDFQFALTPISHSSLVSGSKFGLPMKLAGKYCLRKQKKSLRQLSLLQQQQMQ